MRPAASCPSVLAAAGVAVAVAACGSAARTVSLPARIDHLTAVAPARLRRHRPRAGPLGASTGSTQRTSFAGADLSVTVQRVVDPLNGSGATISPGQRVIGVLVALTNAGPAIYDSSATGDFSVVASHGPVTPVFVAHGICQTPVEDFDRYMTAGAVRTGCVAFAVDGTARVLAVRFSPHDQRAGQLTWSTGVGGR